jgi:hypothetical protein
MSIEEVLLQNPSRFLFSERALALIRWEAAKGCRPDLVVEPVALEPTYHSIVTLNPSQIRHDLSCWTPEPPVPRQKLRRLNMWISPKQETDWVRSERFVKQMFFLGHRVALEILGNRGGIHFQFLCHEADVPTLVSPFKGDFELCLLEAAQYDQLSNLRPQTEADLVVRDFHCEPPYTRLFTQPNELTRSLYATVLAGLLKIPEPILGLYQVVLAPVARDHNWHQNVEMLTTLEYKIKSAGGAMALPRYSQPTPENYVAHMATALEQKAHNDKPFYSVAWRIAILNANGDGEKWLAHLIPASALIQHGGKSLNWLTDEHYRKAFSPEQIQRMLVEGLTYRPGFLMNSWELTSLVHVPPPRLIEQSKKMIELLETLPADETLASGVPIGYCDYAGTRQFVCIPYDLSGKHTQLIGRPGTGKSTQIEHSVLHLIGRGEGVAVIDPHGRLAERILGLIPKDCMDRVIYMDFGDPAWVPIWNPFRTQGNVPRDVIADNLVATFKSVILDQGWGDKLEHLLRYAFLACTHLPKASLYDACNLLRQKSRESGWIRQQVLQVAENNFLKYFLREDFDRYRTADTTSPHHKLSKLLTLGNVSLMLSQRDSLFDLRDIMDSGKILIVNLSSLGPEVKNILGGFLVSSLYLTALGRDSTKSESLRPFHLFVDEAYRFLTDALPDMIVETRKFRVSLTLAHQCLNQFDPIKARAISTMGSTVIYNVNTEDAERLLKDLQGLVESKDIITLETGQAIARFGNKIVRVQTLPPLEVPRDNFAEAIIRQSRSRYYRPAEEVQKSLRLETESLPELARLYDVYANQSKKKRGKPAPPERYPGELTPPETEGKSFGEF